MKEFKSRVDSYSREMMRKDSQIKELQGRIEVGDGCKYYFSVQLDKITTGKKILILINWFLNN